MKFTGLLFGLLTISVLVLGCAQFAPENLNELLHDRPHTQFCYSESVNEVTLRARNFFHTCYQDRHVNVVTPVGKFGVSNSYGATYQISEETLSDGARFVVKNTEVGRYIVAAEISSGGEESCKTRLVAFAGNSGSQTFYPGAIDKFTHGQSSDCPFNTKY